MPPFRETRAYVTKVINEFYRRKIALGAVPASNNAASVPAKQALASAAPVASAALKLASSPAAMPLP